MLAGVVAVVDKTQYLTVRCGEMKCILSDCLYRKVCQNIVSCSMMSLASEWTLKVITV